MTEPVDEQSHYVAVLEAVVAVLAVKAGYNAKTLMANAIRDITKQAGMETVATDDLIQRRWAGRDLTTSVLAAQTVTVDSSVEPQSITETVEKPDMKSRLQGYKERQSEGLSTA